MSNSTQMKADTNEILQLVSFKIANEEFGVDILNVQEINKMTQITKVPNAPDFVEGVINLRGRVIPIIDLRTRLKIEKKEHDKDTRIIVVEIAGKTVGFIVDAVKEVLRIPTSIIEPPPQIATGIDSDFIRAVGKLEDRLLILIDLEKVLTEQDKEQLKSVEN
ncbi:MAG: chemotaxis protein CheW [Stygiobacter sp.]|jgi:purine-binding chemotaxis protein CheW|uniref:Chemotaxis protein CheW n=1 Tax=Stygiobacter electus TaxID=3032292 RepID=A0AAE3NZ29_9BACT|nr:chemotaxis protein CheW [Stygiobacter electus]MDF1611284.1 chemotaxis protein CheW [Stygiobacter electus]